MSHDPRLTARLLAAAATVRPARFQAPGHRDAKDWLADVVNRLRTSAARGESVSLMPHEAWLLAVGIERGLRGKSFAVAFNITAAHRKRSFKPFAMAADSLWREEVLGLTAKQAIAETAELFGLTASRTAFPTAVRDARCRHARNVEAAVAHQMTCCDLSRAEALSAVRFIALEDAALCG